MQSVTQLQHLLEGYRLCCMAEGKSPATTRWYIGKLQIFKAYLEANGFPTDVTRITTHHIRGFLAHLRSDVKADENNPNKPTRDQPLSSRTIQGYARTLKAFYSWLYREGYLNDNPTKLVKIPKASKIIVETLTERQIRCLLKAIDCTTPLGFRDRCPKCLSPARKRVSKVASTGSDWSAPCLCADVDMTRPPVFSKSLPPPSSSPSITRLLSEMLVKSSMWHRPGCNRGSTAQEVLNKSQVLASLQRPRGEALAQTVRGTRLLDAGQLRAIVEDLAHSVGRDGQDLVTRGPVLAG